MEIKKENQGIEKVLTEEITEELGEKNEKKKMPKKKLLIFVIIFSVVIIGLAVILILNGQKTASIAKELELGEKYLEDGLYEEAKLAFDKVIEIDKKEVKGYEGKAEVAIVLKEYPEAEKVLEEAKVLEVTDQGKVLMAEVYINTERKEEGKTLLNDAKNNGMENIKTVKKAAELYNQLQEYNMTIELLEEKILKTENKEALKKLYDALIDVYVKSGKNEEELVALLERIAKETGDSSYIGKKDELLVKIPSFSLAPGIYEEHQSLELIKGKSEDKIYYTLDGSEPTSLGIEYQTPISLKTGNVMIKAIAYNTTGQKSKIIEGSFEIRMSPEESFINNIYGAWKNKSNKGHEAFQLNYPGEESAFFSLSWKSFKYEILNVADDGKSGAIHIYSLQEENPNSTNKWRDSSEEVRIIYQKETNSLLWFDKHSPEEGTPLGYQGEFGMKVKII